MKVLMLGWEYPPEISGGLGVACHGLTLGLSEQNVSVDFILPKVTAKKSWNKVSLREAEEVEWKKVLSEEREWWEDVKVLEIGSYLLPYLSEEQFVKQHVVQKQTKEKTVLKEKLEPLRKKLKGGYGPDLFNEVVKYAIIVGEEATKSDADVIHAHDWMTFEAGVMAKSASGKPLVVHCHSTEFDRMGVHVNQHIYDIERKGFERADAIITVSHQTKELIHLHYGIKLSKIHVVHNGYFPVAAAKPHKRNTFNVSFLGRMVGQKGPEHFVDVARELLRMDDGYRFTMAGSGHMLDELKEKVYKMNLSHYFNFPGFLNQKKLPQFFADTDLFLLTSNSDPFGIVALEAVSAGVPAVLSTKAGVTEVLTHAAKFDPWDTFSIKNFISELKGDPARLKAYTKAQESDLKKASWQRMGEEVVSFYKKLISPK
ncbi:glycosyltransferase family 4 protein [uncultured Imperialibacter sp.]|uniref:glycosyltransferase family 4 protein n=1 Tax=uncultured Imperialibacter sp. TaxID=1672639 RepID=UPI0030D9DF12|tara:strand:- start:5907 stop:7190 length:1284 start_codon:yes stop_codon:yes gene_type:complete